MITADQSEAKMKMLPHNIRLSQMKMLPCKIRGKATSEVEAASQNGATSQDMFQYKIEPKVTETLDTDFLSSLIKTLSSSKKDPIILFIFLALCLVLYF